MKANVTVTLRKGILDPQGKAVSEAINSMNSDSVSDIRIGKFIELTVNADDESSAREKVDQMCKSLLANPVTEDYTIEIVKQG